MPSPLISVITVCYNAASLIEETIQSVLGQDYPNLEYLIIDGASTDGTLDIIKKYADRVKFVSEPDKGIYDAMNKGLKLAQGEWVNFMNAGDTFADCNVVSDVFENRELPANVQVIIGTTYDVYSDRRVLRPLQPVDEIAMYIPFCHQSSFTRIGTDNHWSFDTTYKMAADYNLFYNIWERYGAEAFLQLDMPVACYRMEGSTSYVNMHRTKGEYLHIRSRHRNLQWWKEWLKWHFRK
ncbi:MAG: glycosyltransferase [Bacteroidales bacterium]|nr:glycosyltransferase [Bacteroidales bacterium]